MNHRMNFSRRKFGFINVMFILIALFVIGGGIFIAVFGGSAFFSSFLGVAEENISGKNFTISMYDSYANKTMQIHGTKVTMGLLENSANWDYESTDFKSEVLEITVNGNQMFQVGDTLIVAEEGLDQIDDFYLPESMEVTSGGGFVPVDRFVNDYKNMMGKEKIIVIKSSLGIPIAIYQGKEVYVTVPSYLPKTTLLEIDGQALYIHRANYSIFDAEIFKQ